MCITTKYISINIANFLNDIRSYFTYVEDPLWRNKSNRLKKIEKYNSKYFDLSGEYSYDPDGNFLTLTRSYNSDNFSYQYYTGTNRLKKVSGTTDQYTYDYNGNQTNDYLNNNTGIKYDHRNLITEFTRQDLNQDPPITDITRYKYDESGNRIRKTIYRSTESNPPPLPEETEDLPTGWSIILDDYYLRDASGKEIAIYSSYTLQYWNVWSGNEIVGRINNTENADRNYYLKDHLGSIRAVLDNSKNIVSANDYDMWGYYLQNRTYSTTNTKNKFTGKERDNESSYDYFGARYYDARVGRWGGEEPLVSKYQGFSSYIYGLCNPLTLKDVDGKWIPEYDGENNRIIVRPEKNDNVQSLVSQLGINSEQFIQDQINLGINNFDIQVGETNFNITQYVIGDKTISSNNTPSNCHGFVAFIKGYIDEEKQMSGYEFSQNLGGEIDKPIIGSIAVFEISEEIKDFNGRNVPKGEPGHSAIYTIKDQKGISYYLNRLNTGQNVQISSQNKINEYYLDLEKQYNEFGINVNISKTPKYY